MASSDYVLPCFAPVRVLVLRTISTLYSKGRLKPLHTKVITDMILSRGLWHTSGKTPAANPTQFSDKIGLFNNGLVRYTHKKGPAIRQSQFGFQAASLVKKG